MPRKREYEIDNVVDKAMYTFWNNGYGSTSVRQLEKDMGINQFSIYSCFGNKHDLFVEVLKSYKSHVKQTFLKELLLSKGNLDDIKNFFLDFGHGISSGEHSNGCLMVNTGMEMGQSDPEIASELTSYFAFIKGSFYATLEAAKSVGELPSKFNSNKHAEFLLGSLQGLSLYAKFRKSQEINDFVDSIMSTLK